MQAVCAQVLTAGIQDRTRVGAQQPASKTAHAADRQYLRQAQHAGLRVAVLLIDQEWKRCSKVIMIMLQGV